MLKREEIEKITDESKVELIIDLQNQLQSEKMLTEKLRRFLTEDKVRIDIIEDMISNFHCYRFN